MCGNDIIKAEECRISPGLLRFLNVNVMINAKCQRMYGLKT